MMNKNNVPYYIAGTLATFTLLASGVFAAAPYIGFLAPVAALSVGLPFIIGCAVFSAVAIALSYAAISKNKTISEKEAQLADEKSKVEAKNKIISEKEAVVQDQKQTISELEAKIQAQEQTISRQNDQLTRKEAEVKAKEEENSEQKTQLTEKDKKIEEDALKVAIVDNAVYGLNTAWDASCLLAKGAVNGTVSLESTKGALGSIGSSLKNACGTSVRYVGEKLNSVGSSLYSRIYGTKVSSKEKFESRIVQRKQEEAKARTELKASGLLPDVIRLPYKVSSPEEQLKREDGSKPSMQELTRLDYLGLAVLSSEQKQRANSLDYLNIDNVPKQPGHLNVDAAKSYLMSLSEDQDVFYDAESGDEKGTEISSPESQPTKEENGQGWFAWSLGKAKSAMTEVVVIGADVTKPYFAKVTKALAT